MKKVVIVEDNISQQFLLTHFLNKYFDCEVKSADNGKDGLEMINSDKPDLILLDIALPVMDGLKVLENLRNIYKINIPVIIMTAIDERSTLTKLMALGISDYMLKPYNIFSMHNKISRHLPSNNSLS